MKESITKLNQFQKTLIIFGIVSFILISLSTIGLFFGQPGWIIGVTIGCIVEFISFFLVQKGTTATLKNSKIGTYFVSYFIRMALFLGFFILFVVLQYKLQVETFKNAYWGMAIGYFPFTFITIFSELKFSKEK